MVRKLSMIVLVMLLLAAAPMPASVAATGQSAAPVATGAAGDAVGRPLDLPDILEWKRIRSDVLSRDGGWFAYVLQPNEGDSELVIRAVAGDTEHRLPMGELPPFGAGGAVAFSRDSAWLAYERRPTVEQAKAARKAKKPATSAAVLVELASGDTHELENQRSFAFSGDGWLAVHRAAEATGAQRAGGDRPGGEQPGGRDGDAYAAGTDLLLRRLADGVTLTLGNVAEYAFNEPGDLLAVTVATAAREGNGVLLHQLSTGRVIPLDSGDAWYRRLSWTEEGDALAVLAGSRAEGAKEDRYGVLGFTDLLAPQPRRVAYDPAADESFPADLTVSEQHTPSWNEDRDALIFRIHEAEQQDEESDEEAAAGAEGAADEGGEAKSTKARPSDEDLDPADLVIWHWRDRRLQSRQKVQESADRRFGYLATYRIDEDRFLRLADEQVRDAAPAPKQRFALAADVAPYERIGSLEGRRYEDVYVVDMRTGERELALEKARWTFGASPAGTHFLYFEEGNFYSYDMETGTSANLTGELPVPFWNEEDDHNVVMPPRFQFGLGWSEDGRSLVLSDGWDLWKVPVEGGTGVNLTGDGRERQIRYGPAFRLDPDAEGLDLTAPLYVRAYSEWTKEAGIARIDPAAGGAEMLVWDAATFGNLVKAEDADVWLMTREDFREFPDYRRTDANLTVGERITDANPQQADHAWSPGVQIVDYTSAKGDRLQGALFLPAGYEPGRSYPTVVYIYEKLSQGANRYSVPTAGGFNASVYTSNGYAVLMPDITYQVDDPGMSAVWSVLPALDAAIATGVVDPDAVGLHGHSWGGYQTSFLVTQTDRFTAAVAGAPLTNMISMYALIYKNSGGGNGAIFESSQGRFTGGPWEVPDAYVRNSPVYHAANVTTPLVLLHNDQDGAVDFTQGVEYYNTLRRLDKNVVMLQYVGENHGLRDEANRKDYTIRMREFFDHYLRDLGMPAWLRDGVPYLEREDHLKERARALQTLIEQRR